MNNERFEVVPIAFLSFSFKLEIQLLFLVSVLFSLVFFRGAGTVLFDELNDFFLFLPFGKHLLLKDIIFSLLLGFNSF
jgi:hypothetical protein